jgi:hypothetical protein
MARTTLRGWVCFLFLLIATFAVAQQQSQWRTTFQLQDTLQRSGYVFAGRVLSVRYDAPNAANEVASVRITFRVEQGVRGTRTGSTLTIREWAGLWQGGARYRVGERVVLFLHPPSKLGLTSPVNGDQGRYNVDAQGNVEFGANTGGAGDPAKPPAAMPLRKFMRTIRQVQAQE